MDQYAYYQANVSMQIAIVIIITPHKFHLYNQQLNYINPIWLGWGFGAFMNAYDGCPFKLSKAETLI